MARDIAITVEWGDEEHSFRLSIGPQRRLEAKCDAGVPELLARLSPAAQAIRAKLTVEQMITHGLLGRFRIDDVRTTILEGLCGAGMALTPAEALVKARVDAYPIVDSVPLAYSILYAVYFGFGDEPLGEGRGEQETGASLSPEAAPASQSSTETARP